MGEKNPDYFLGCLRITFYFFLIYCQIICFRRRFTAKYLFSTNKISYVSSNV